MLYKRRIVDYVLSQIGKIIKFMLIIILRNIVEKKQCATTTTIKVINHIEIVNPFRVSLSNSGSLS